MYIVHHCVFQTTRHTHAGRLKDKLQHNTIGFAVIVKRIDFTAHMLQKVFILCFIHALRCMGESIEMNGYNLIKEVSLHPRVQRSNPHNEIAKQTKQQAIATKKP